MQWTDKIALDRIASKHFTIDIIESIQSLQIFYNRHML